PLYTTKGDANNASDRQGVLNNQIVGKVVLNIPFLGYAVNFVKKPIGFLLIIIVPAGMIILDEVKKIYNEIKKKKNKDE
ncbi:MAG: signal peptidase I, partial [Patescibacteria group bacterium]|nr:signal peptidase I [Patescibacteria group bacterium]